MLREYKDKLQTGRKVFANHISNRGTVAKELSKLNKKTNHPIKK